jgi:hypothetical protein
MTNEDGSEICPRCGSDMQATHHPACEYKDGTPTGLTNEQIRILIDTEASREEIERWLILHPKMRKFAEMTPEQLEAAFASARAFGAMHVVPVQMMGKMPVEDVIVAMYGLRRSARPAGDDAGDFKE